MKNHSRLNNHNINDKSGCNFNNSTYKSNFDNKTDSKNTKNTIHQNSKNIQSNKFNSNVSTISRTKPAYKASDLKNDDQCEYYKNSEINNKRFDKSAKTPSSYKPHPSNESKFNKSNQKENFKSGNKYLINKNNQIKQDYDYDYDIEHEINLSKKNEENNSCEENVQNLPKPLDIKIEAVDILKLNDFKSTKPQKYIAPSNGNLNQNVLYIPDHVATKLVDEILQSKLRK